MTDAQKAHDLLEGRITFIGNIDPTGVLTLGTPDDVMRAEIPGSFSALPTRAEAMYAPELRANSDEIKLSIID